MTQNSDQSKEIDRSVILFAPGCSQGAMPAGEGTVQKRRSSLPLDAKCLREFNFVDR